MSLNSSKLQFYEVLPEESTPKLASGKINWVNFCKLAQITNKFDNFRQGVPLPLSQILSKIIDFLLEAL